MGFNEVHKKLTLDSTFGQRCSKRRRQIGGNYRVLICLLPTCSTCLVVKLLVWMLFWS